jgi:hypothetical protein
MPITSQEGVVIPNLLLPDTLFGFHLMQPKDALDKLADDAIYLSMRARGLEDQAPADAGYASLLAVSALHLISDQVKHYPFVERRFTDSGWIFDSAGRLSERSGSMRGEPMTEEAVHALATIFLNKAQAVLAKFSQPASSLIEFDSSSHMVLSTATPIDFDRFLTIGEPNEGPCFMFVVDDAAPFAADRLPTAGAIGGVGVDSMDALTGAIRVNSVDELVATLVQLFSN